MTVRVLIEVEGASRELRVDLVDDVYGVGDGPYRTAARVNALADEAVRRMKGALLS